MSYNGPPKRRKSFVRNGPGRRELRTMTGLSRRQFKKYIKGRRRRAKANPGFF